MAGNDVAMTILSGGLEQLAYVGGCVVTALALVGIVYTLAVAAVFRCFFRRRPAPGRRSESVSVLKPLCGSEPAMSDNLATFALQSHIGELQILLGLARPDDPAHPAASAFRTKHAGVDIGLVVSDRRHGTNAKVSNLLNMVAHAAHDTLILSDSDIVVPPDYLSIVLDTLDDPSVGAVSLLYCGRGDAGFWSRFGAAGLSYQFLPGAVFGVAMDLATPCMGSTIAMRRQTFDRIGGLVPLADELADDYLIGEALRSEGLRVEIPSMLVTHASTERSLRELWRHEVRWGATIRNVVPARYVGSIVTMPVPLALLGGALCGHPMLATLTIAGALVARHVLLREVDRIVGARTVPGAWLPVRDLFSFAVFFASLFARTVEWRGARHRFTRRRLAPETEFPA